MSAIPATLPDPTLRAQALLEAEWVVATPSLTPSSEGASHERRRSFLFAAPEGGFTVLSVVSPVDAAERPTGPDVAEVTTFRTLARALGEMARQGDAGEPSWERKAWLKSISGRPEVLEALVGEVPTVVSHPEPDRFRASSAFGRLRAGAAVLDALEVAAGEQDIQVEGSALQPKLRIVGGKLAYAGYPALEISITEDEPKVRFRNPGLPAVDGPREDVIGQVLEVAGRVRDAAGRTEGAGLSGWSALPPAAYADPVAEAARAALRIEAIERESTGQPLMRARAVRLMLEEKPQSSKAHWGAAKFFSEMALRQSLHPERAGWETLARRHEVQAVRLQDREAKLKEDILAHI